MTSCYADIIFFIERSSMHVFGGCLRCYQSQINFTPRQLLIHSLIVHGPHGDFNIWCTMFQLSHQRNDDSLKCIVRCDDGISQFHRHGIKFIWFQQDSDIGEDLFYRRRKFVGPHITRQIHKINIRDAVQVC
ncbi:hypothetical protein A3N58_03310 [Klebsiella aerogenes]|nr:hypothetical protein A3N58_03310 [Klebsiella aerogenes]